VRVFAGEHPEKVCGLVLVEPSQLRFEMWIKEHRPEEYRASYADTSGSSGFRQHIASFDLALREAEEAALPKVPVYILTGSREDPGEAEKRRMWVSLHRELAASIPLSRHIVSTNSAHGIVSNEPELVSTIIVDMISGIKLSNTTQALGRGYRN
jgi:pimeloyl-ACP methyl ester carboxylesterase